MFSIAFSGVLYGIAATHYNLFPYQQIGNFKQTISIVQPYNKALSWYFIPTIAQNTVTAFVPEKIAPGLTKIVSVEGNFGLAVKILDGKGNIIQQWDIEWHDIWPENPSHLTEDEIPKSRPGTHIHGAEILKNGDLVFNFEHLALVRIDPCGNVVWRLPFRTHHSIFVDESENLWVSAQLNHNHALSRYPFIKPPFIEPIILKISPDGHILKQKSVFDLLIANGHESALYATSIDNEMPIVTGDTLHLNDVEVFPSSLNSGTFSPGDIMISLRNINTIMVFDSEWQLKYRLTGEFIRQHDPDFIDGNTISVFDNRNISPLGNDSKSRILVYSSDTGASRIAFEGTKQTPFFTNIMGKHQWLSNGNLLLSESRYGRALEITNEGNVVWEYYNLVEPGWLGILEEAERLPEDFTRDFFVRARDLCSAQTSLMH